MAKRGIESIIVYSRSAAVARAIAKLYFNWEVTNTNVEENKSYISYSIEIEDLLGFGILPYPDENYSKYIDVTFQAGSNEYQTRITEDSINIGDVLHGSSHVGARQIIASGQTEIFHETSDYQPVTVYINIWNFVWYYEPSKGDLISFFSAKWDITLDNIQRYASLTRVVDFNDEESPVITYSNPAGDYAISVQAGISLTTSDASMAIPYRDISKTGTSYTFIFTESELSSLYTVLDDKLDSKVVRVFIKSTVPSIDGSTYDTVTDYKDVTLTFINYKPTLNISLKDTNQRSLAVTGNNQIFVRGISDVQFDLGAKVYKGSTIKNIWIQNGDKLINSGTGYLTEVATNTFYAYVEDNRGYYAAKEIIIPTSRWIEYFPLTCALKTALLDGSGTIDITISGKFFTGNFGVTSNSMRMEYHIINDITLEDTYSPLTPITPIVDSEGNYTYTFTVTGLDYKSRYRLRVLTIDSIMTDYSSFNSIVSAIPVFDWGKNDFAFYVPVYMDDVQVLRRSNDVNSTILSSDGTIYLRPEGTTDTTGEVQIDANACRVGGLNLTGLAKAMTQRYELPCEVTVGANWSTVDCNLYLYGNTIRGYLNCVRKESSGTGDIQNEIVCSVTFDSGNKVTDFSQVSFCSGGKGTPATFNMADTVVFPNDGSVDESKVGKGYFNIYLTSAAQADTEWQCFFCFPATIDLNKF